MNNTALRTKDWTAIYCDLQNECKFDRPLKNAWMRGIPIQDPFFIQGIKKRGPKSFRNGRSNLQVAVATVTARTGQRNKKFAATGKNTATG